MDPSFGGSTLLCKGVVLFRLAPPLASPRRRRSTRRCSANRCGPSWLWVTCEPWELNYLLSPGNLAGSSINFLLSSTVIFDIWREAPWRVLPPKFRRPTRLNPKSPLPVRCSALRPARCSSRRTGTRCATRTTRGRRSSAARRRWRAGGRVGGGPVTSRLDACMM